MRRFFTVAVVLVLSGCVRRVVPPTEVLDQANEAAAQPNADSRTLALAGWHALLLTGNADEARARFDSSLERSAAEPWALYGQAMLALRSASPQRALGAALDLCERNPRHPLSAPAARVVLEVAGNAASTDQLIIDRVPAMLEKGLLTEAAQLLRSSLATIYQARHDLPRHAQTVLDMGVPTAATLVGPFSAWHVLSAGERTAPETTGSMSALGRGPFGELQPRTIRFADGRFSLGGEPTTGDVYVLAVDATVTQGGRYEVRSTSSMDHVVTIDGTVVIERLTWQHPAPTLLVRDFELPAGQHRLMVRMTKEEALGFLTIGLVRVDGQPSRVTFEPAQGPAPKWSGLELPDREPVRDGAPAVYRELFDEGGEALARFIAARDSLGRHRDGAWRMMNALPPTVNVHAAEGKVAEQPKRSTKRRARITKNPDGSHSIESEDGE